MRYALPIAAVLLASVGATAQQPAWNEAEVVEVRLSSFDFSPSTIRLTSGRPVILRLVNTAGGGHNFSAPQFFAEAQIREADQALLSKGAVEVRGQSSQEIALIPQAGHYDLKCTHTLHTLFGMKGNIVVD